MINKYDHFCPWLLHLIHVASIHSESEKKKKSNIRGEMGIKTENTQVLPGTHCPGKAIHQFHVFLFQYVPT